MIKRIILIVLDSVGVGAMPDAVQYGDEGADTAGHIVDFMGKDWFLPNLAKLGFYKIINTKFHNDIKDEIIACYGKAATASPAKDTTAGHWEISGIILQKPFPTYPDGFPKSLIDKFEKLTGLKILGNCPASGTEIINLLGDKHCSTGFPIVYTSADSVFQIAAHEKYFGLDKLYKICEIAREMLAGEHAVGRVIARPFIGENGAYTRTSNRKDYSLSPFENTVLDEIKNAEGQVTAVGKIEDIFNSCGITKAVHTKSNADGISVTKEEIKSSANSPAKTLIFTNLVDFDMLWGHRRNIPAYAKALKEFDDFVPELISMMSDDDLLIITADHGCDPSFLKHTDHTREYVPLLVYGKKIKKNIDLGVRKTLSDIAQTIADIFSLGKMKNGTSFKNEIMTAGKLE